MELAGGIPPEGFPDRSASGRGHMDEHWRGEGMVNLKAELALPSARIASGQPDMAVSTLGGRTMRRESKSTPQMEPCLHRHACRSKGQAEHS
jgi:hypothetical protein